MTAFDIIGRALQGDEWALNQFTPGRRAALIRTGDRLRALPDAVNPLLARCKTPEEREDIMREALEAALVELEPRPAELN